MLVGTVKVPTKAVVILVLLHNVVLVTIRVTILVDVSSIVTMTSSMIQLSVW